MQCPYCGETINTNVQYCPKCGQSLETARNDKATDSYWEQVGNDNSANTKEKNEREARFVSEQKAQLRKKLITAIFVAAAILIVIITVNSINKTNQAKLSGYYQSMIGNTYSDSNKGMFTYGESVERRLVIIQDDSTLKYQEGTYIARQNSSGHGFTWAENNVSSPVTYEYTLSIGLTGKVKLNFNNRSCPVYLEEDKVRSIDLY